jgi:hypothetical protein
MWKRARVVPMVGFMLLASANQTFSADGLKGGEFMLPQVAGEIRLNCKTRFPTIAADRYECEQKNSQGYWRMLGIIEWLDEIFKDSPRDYRITARNIVLTCQRAWQSDIGGEYYMITRCLEKQIKKITGKDPVYRHDNDPGID